MDNLIKTFLLTALIVFPLGFAVGSSVGSDDNNTTNTEEETHAHADDGLEAPMSQAHGTQEVESENAPEIVNFKVTEDNKSGWNVSFETENFRFAPENASSPHVAGEGHAHIYVDGKKVTRLYSGNYYLGELSEGSHTVKVTLNTNDHKDYTVNGKVVEASQLVADMHHTEDSEDDHSN